MNLLNGFEWISRKTEEAILAGVARAVARLDGDPSNELAELPAELRNRLALPAPTGEPQNSRTRRNGKADATTAP